MTSVRRVNTFRRMLGSCWLTYALMHSRQKLTVWKCISKICLHTSSVNSSKISPLLPRAIAAGNRRLVPRIASMPLNEPEYRWNCKMRSRLNSDGRIMIEDSELGKSRKSSVWLKRQIMGKQKRLHCLIFTWRTTAVPVRPHRWRF